MNTNTNTENNFNISIDKKDYFKKYYQNHQLDLCSKAKEYYTNNIDKRKVQMINYNNKHKDKFYEQKAEKHQCECGCEITYGNKSRHLQSKKHITIINNKSQNIN